MLLIEPCLTVEGLLHLGDVAPRAPAASQHGVVIVCAGTIVSIENAPHPYTKPDDSPYERHPPKRAVRGARPGWRRGFIGHRRPGVGRPNTA